MNHSPKGNESRGRKVPSARARGGFVSWPRDLFVHVADPFPGRARAGASEPGPWRGKHCRRDPAAKVSVVASVALLWKAGVRHPRACPNAGRAKHPRMPQASKSCSKRATLLRIRRSRQTGVGRNRTRRGRSSARRDLDGPAQRSREQGSWESSKSSLAKRIEYAGCCASFSSCRARRWPMSAPVRGAPKRSRLRASAP
jgi:hypothetical protein